MGIAQAAHIAVTNWGPDGARIVTTERVAGVSDARLGIWVGDIAPWRERFAGSDVVTVQECSLAGKPKLEEPLLEGHVQLLTSGPLFDEVKAAIHAKYGMATAVEGVLDTVGELLGRATDEGVVLIDVVG